MGRHRSDEEEAEAMKGAALKNRQRVALYDGPDPIDVHVGKRMRERRLRQGLLLEDVAAGIGVKMGTVQKYEIARHRISASMLYRVCKALNVGPAYFFHGLEGASGVRPRRKAKR
jgi:ribosome-binding protein aMBF1 (putative translation factor)